MKIYFAGKVSPVDGVQDWRNVWANILAEKTGLPIVNLDPTKADENLGEDLDLGNPDLIFGRDCYLIKESDAVIINLTDDVGVGASQEMIIAKYFGKPLIAVTKLNGRYWREERVVDGKSYKNWINPFVSIPCDLVVERIEDSVDFLMQIKSQKIKDISVIDSSTGYYQGRRT
ncbi:MAG: hypothetical protein AAB726_02890 [Patescibacteria group bacterium]